MNLKTKLIQIRYHTPTITLFVWFVHHVFQPCLMRTHTYRMREHALDGGALVTATCIQCVRIEPSDILAGFPSKTQRKSICEF